MSVELTERELEVLALAKNKLKNKEIAEALGIKTGTVKIHLKHCRAKIGELNLDRGSVSLVRQLQQENAELKRRIKELDDQNTTLSWQVSPDRMGQ